MDRFERAMVGPQKVKGGAPHIIGIKIQYTGCHLCFQIINCQFYYSWYIFSPFNFVEMIRALDLCNTPVQGFKLHDVRLLYSLGKTINKEGEHRDDFIRSHLSTSDRYRPHVV